MKFQSLTAKIRVHDSEARPPWRNSPRIGAEVGSAYAKSRASVSERKHIKDGVLLKEERKKGKQRRREQIALFPASYLSFWFRVLCVLSSELRRQSVVFSTIVASHFAKIVASKGTISLPREEHNAITETLLILHRICVSNNRIPRLLYRALGATLCFEVECFDDITCFEAKSFSLPFFNRRFLHSAHVALQ